MTAEIFINYKLQIMYSPVRSQCVIFYHSCTATSMHEEEVPDTDPLQPKYPQQGIPRELWNISNLSDLQMKFTSVLFDVEDYARNCIKCTRKELETWPTPRPEDTEWGKKMICPVHKKFDGLLCRKLLAIKNKNVVDNLEIYYKEDIRNNDHTMFLRSDMHETYTLQNYALESSGLNMATTLAYFRQTVSALHFLHSQHIILCGLQAKTIYITNNKSVVKIADFSRACLLEMGLYDSDINSTCVYPFKTLGFPGCQQLSYIQRWLPRECNDFGEFSMRSDVASFAHVMWETLRAVEAPPKSRPEKLAPYAAVALSQVVEMQRRRQMLPQPSVCPTWMYNVMKRCMLDPPHRRPLLPSVMQCLSAGEPHTHPLARSFDSSDNSNDIFNNDDVLYGIHAVGTREYRSEKLQQIREQHEVCTKSPMMESDVSVYRPVNESEEYMYSEAEDDAWTLNMYSNMHIARRQREPSENKWGVMVKELAGHMTGYEMPRYLTQEPQGVSGADEQDDDVYEEIPCDDTQLKHAYYANVATEKGDKLLVYDDAESCRYIDARYFDLRPGDSETYTASHGNSDGANVHENQLYTQTETYLDVRDIPDNFYTNVESYRKHYECTVSIGSEDEEGRSEAQTQSEAVKNQDLAEGEESKQNSTVPMSESAEKFTGEIHYTSVSKPTDRNHNQSAHTSPEDGEQCGTGTNPVTGDCSDSEDKEEHWV